MLIFLIIIGYYSYIRCKIFQKIIAIRVQIYTQQK